MNERLGMIGQNTGFGNEQSTMKTFFLGKMNQAKILYREEKKVKQ